MLFQKKSEFVAEAGFSMMLFLSPYKITHSIQVRGAYAEGSVSGLPCKEVSLFVHPLGGTCLERPEQNCDCDLRRECRDDVNMILRASDGINLDTVFVSDSSQARPQTIAHLSMNAFATLIRREDKVDVIAGVCV